jgi:hypothetical protein
MHLHHGPLKELLTIEPIVVVGERVDSGVGSQTRLAPNDPRISKIVMTEIRRNMRLIVTMELGSRFVDIDPLSKSFSPPFIVLRNSVVLGQVKCEQ